MKFRASWLLAAVLMAGLLHTLPAAAYSSPSEVLPNPAEEARAEAIGQQLRCMVCQNESVEQSDADLARDLRTIIRRKVAAGDSNQQIIAWMVARYGDFIRLDPPLDAMTLALWGAPFIALAIGFAVVGLARLRAPTPPPPPLDAIEGQHLAELLGDDPRALAYGSPAPPSPGRVNITSNDHALDK